MSSYRIVQDLREEAQRKGIPIPEYMCTQGYEWMSRRGIANLVLQATLCFEEATGILFPWQETQGGEELYYRWVKPEEHQAELEQAARYAGWLNTVAAGNFPKIKKVLKQGMSQKGYDSPSHHFTAEDLCAKFPSPGRLERLLNKVRSHADQILEPYLCTTKPMWLHVAKALLKNGRARKAGFIAAAMTLSLEKSLKVWHQCCGCGSAMSYSKARQVLADVSLSNKPIELGRRNYTYGSLHTGSYAYPRRFSVVYRSETPSVESGDFLVYEAVAVEGPSRETQFRRSCFYVLRKSDMIGRLIQKQEHEASLRSNNHPLANAEVRLLAELLHRDLFNRLLKQELIWTWFE